MQRPPAKELLKHRYIKTAKKTSYLTELIERKERWFADGHAVEEEDRDDGYVWTHLQVFLLIL
jgi:serine/threonine-protein kinase 24/25/MST4